LLGLETGAELDGVTGETGVELDFGADETGVETMGELLELDGVT
jgi:hypothetical protein